MDIALNNEWDIDLSVSNSARLVDGTGAIEQHWRSRMQTFQGEWLLDQRIGLPYYQSILVKNPEMPSISFLFRRATLETPGIASVTYCNLALDRATRKLTVVVEGKYDAAVFDGTYRYVYEELILPQAGTGEN